MPKAGDGQNESALDLAFLPFNVNIALQACEPLAAGMAELGGKACRNWMDINRQWAAFLMQRFQEDASLMHNLAKCTNPQDVYGAYSNFIQKALADYQRQFTEMMKLGPQSFAAATTAAQKSMVVGTRETMGLAA
jgi:hypothetical protein